MMRSFLTIILAAALLLTSTSGAFMETFDIDVLVANEIPALPLCGSGVEKRLRYHLTNSTVINTADYFNVNLEDVPFTAFSRWVYKQLGQRALRGSAGDEVTESTTATTSRSLATYSYKVVFSGTGSFTCRLCKTDNADRRRQLFSKAAYDAYMSDEISKDINVLNRAYVERLNNGTSTCLGSGAIPLKVVFTSTV
jgi:hypothetical protein